MDYNDYKYVGIKEDGEFTSAPNEQQFLKEYICEWAKTVSGFYFKDECIDTGHKLRPRLVYWGFLAGNPVETDKIQDVSRIAVAIELIHKSSLLLDDYIDKDTLRHNRRTFYLEHGVERTIMYSLNLLSTSLSIVNEVLKQYPEGSSLQYISMQGLIKCMYDMSLGVLIELDTNMTKQTSIDDVIKIVNLQTSSLIQVSLLLGYYLSPKISNTTEKALKEIGQCTGFAFQMLNDLESVFGSTVEEHKGSGHNDIVANRKNYCYAILQTLMSHKEHNSIIKGDISDLDNLFTKYSVKNIVINEIEACGARINSLVKDNNALTEEWKEGFLSFYQSIISTYLNRLSDFRK